MKTKMKRNRKPVNLKRMRASDETAFTQAVMDGLDVIDKDRIFKDAETRELFGLNPKKTAVKTKFKQLYGWAETISKKRGFTRLTEADWVRLVRESRDSLDTFEPCTQ
jgi:hypothetical protein